MAVSFVAAGSFQGAAGSITPGLPAGVQDGDLLMLFVEAQNQTPATPSGWTIAPSSPQVTGTAGAATSTGLYTFWRIWTTGVTAPTIANPGDHVSGVIVAWRGTHQTSPFDTSAGDVASTASATCTWQTVTSVVANQMIVLAVSNTTDTNTAQGGTLTNANLSSLQERADGNTNAANGGGLTVACGVKGSIGATGTTTCALATSSTQGRGVWALKEAPTPVSDSITPSYGVIGKAVNTLTPTYKVRVIGPNFEQAVTATNDSTATSLSTALIQITANNLYIIFFTYDVGAGDVSTTISCSRGGSVSSGPQNVQCGSQRMSVCYYIAPSTGSGNFTALMTGSRSFRRIAVVEYSNNSLFGVVSDAATLPNFATASGVAGMTGPAMATGLPYQMVLGAADSTNGTDSGVVPSSGWIGRASVANYLRVEEKILASPGSATPSWDTTVASITYGGITLSIPQLSAFSSLSPSYTVKKQVSDSITPNYFVNGTGMAWRSANVAQKATTTGTTMTLTVPPGTVVGDLMVVSVALAQIGTISMPAGWTLIDSRADPTNAIQFATFWKVADAADVPPSTTFTVTVTTGTTAWSEISSFYGVDTTTPIDASSVNTGTTSPITGTGVTTGSNQEVAYMVAGQESTNPKSSFTPGAGLTERFDWSSQGTPVTNPGASNTGATTNQLSAGATGNLTITSINPTSGWVAQVIVPKLLSGVTSVSDSITPAYGITAAVSDALTSSYNVTISVADTLNPSYTVKISASDTVSASYTVKTSVSDTLSPSYTVKVSVSDTLSASYFVRISVTDTLTASYTVKIAATDTFTPTYTVRQSIADTVVPNYNVRTQVSDTLSASYFVRISVADTLSASYFVKISVSDTLSVSYFVRISVSDTFAPSYTIKILATDTVSASYLVKAQVSDTVNPNYLVRQQVADTLSVTYTIVALGAVSDIVSVSYTVRQSISDTLSSSYFVRISVSDSFSASYIVKIQVADTVSVSYIIKVQIADSLSPSYNVKAFVSDSLTATYAIALSLIFITASDSATGVEGTSQISATITTTDSAAATDLHIDPIAINEAAGESASGTDTTTTLSATVSTQEAGSGVDANNGIILSGRTDSGAGVDAHIDPISISGPFDIGNGVDLTGSINENISTTDSATGTDAHIDPLGIAQGAGESGSGAEATGQVAVVFTSSDTSIGTDAHINPIVLFGPSESGTGNEAAGAITGLYTTTDTGSGLDVVSAFTNAFSSTDTGSGNDASAVTIVFISADTGSGVDARQILVLLSASDAISSGAETSSIASALTTNDSGSGLDQTVGITNAQTAFDAGIGQDVVSFNRVVFSAFDLGAGLETLANVLVIPFTGIRVYTSFGANPSIGVGSSPHIKTDDKTQPPKLGRGSKPVIANVGSDPKLG